MNDDQNKKITELREKLKHGRAGEATGGAGEAAGGIPEGIERNHADSDPTQRTTLQAARGTLKPLTPTGGEPGKGNRGIGDHQRGAARVPRRLRRTDGRSGESDERLDRGSDAPDASGSEGSASGPRAIGNLIAEGEILRVNKPDATFTEAGQSNGTVPSAKRFKEDYRRTQRLTANGLKENVYALISDGAQYIDSDEYKKLESKTSSNSDSEVTQGSESDSERPNPFAKGPLTQREAEELSEPFTTALPDVGHYIDQAFWLYNPAQDGHDIWGRMSRPEAEMIAEGLLSWGQHNTVVATGIRETVYLKKYAAIAAFVIPRAKETVQLVRTAPKRQRKPLRLFRNEGVSNAPAN